MVSSPKRTILASCIPGALCWIIIASSPHLSPLILGRILSGIAGGFSSSNCSLLVAQYRFLFIRIVQCSGLMSYSLLEDCLNNSNLRQLHPLPHSLDDI